MPINNTQRKANEKHFDVVMGMLKPGGFYGWIDQQEMMFVALKKDKPVFILTRIQYSKLALIVSPKWLNKNTILNS